MKKLYFTIIPVVAILAVLFYLREIRSTDSRQPSFETVKVERGDIEVKVLSTGTIEPYTRVEVRSSVNGRIDRVEVDEGSTVKEGDILAWISSEDRIALLDAARSALESARQAKDEEATRQAKAVYDVADRAYKPVPLTNSIHGEVINRSCEPGQNVSTQSVLFAIADRLVARVAVDEADIGRIRPGQNTVIVLDAFPDQRVRANVTKISREGSLVSGVVEYAVLVEPFEVPRHWASGMTANVEFVVEKKEGILLIPRSALVEQDGGSFVRILAEGPTRRRIEVGITDGKLVEVSRGLSEGEAIILGQTESGSARRTERRPSMPMMMRPR
ncbi:MAG: HlyD family efflux transporter periplasmic adaptor subunit [Candidatus Eisenbacteria bacterium]